MWCAAHTHILRARAGAYRHSTVCCSFCSSPYLSLSLRRWYTVVVGTVITVLILVFNVVLLYQTFTNGGE